MTSQDSCLKLVKALSAKVGVPLQGSGKFAREAYYVVVHLLRLIVLLPIINKYIVTWHFGTCLKAELITCLCGYSWHLQVNFLNFFFQNL